MLMAFVTTIITRFSSFSLEVIYPHFPSEQIIMAETRTEDLRVFTAVTMKNAVFWVVAPCRYCRLSLQPSANAGSSLADFFFFSSTLKMESII
jgi:hypothetical protein